MPTVFNCSCGGHNIPVNQRGLHERTKAHSEWVEANGLPTYDEHDNVDNLPDELSAAIAVGRRDPLECAKLVRKYLSTNPFTDFCGYGTVRALLEAYDIPILDIPKGTTRPIADKLLNEFRYNAAKEYAQKS